MSLVDKDIKRLMESGNIIIEPFDQKQLGPNTYDIKLGKTILKPIGNKELIVDPTAQLQTYRGSVCNSGVNYDTFETPYVLMPGEFILASTKEKIGVFGNVIATVFGRSGGSRLGLVMDTGPFIDTGFEGFLTFGVYNQAPYSILLQEDYRIGHVEFTKTSGNPDVSYDKRKISKYAGKQMEGKPVGWLLDKEWR